MSFISGLVSGFDWQAMLLQIREVEHRRIDLVEDRKADYEAQLSEWQSFNTKLLALKTSAEGLKDPEDFYLYTANMTTDSATVDGDDLLSVSTTTSASTGSYEIVVTNLATSQKLSSNPFTSQTAELGSSYADDMIINGKVLIVSSTDSLADVAYNVNALNTGTNPSGVTATVVKYGDNDYRLILTSDDTGEDGISLLNGSSTNLVQKFGWKDKQTAVIKNSITEGAQSDRFTAHNVAVKSLLGLSTGEASTGTLTIDGTAVTINLSTMSLTDIKDAINNAMAAAPRTDIVASVISETKDGSTYYRLQIEGTQTFVDENNVLNTLGVLHNNSAEITAANTEISGNSMTSDGAYITPDTLLVDIDGYISWTSGDKITFTGTQTGGAVVGPYDFSITTSTTVQDLLDDIETQYSTSSGDAIAYVTSDGKIRVDDVAAGGSLDVILADVIANGELEFVDGDLSFGDASARAREIVAGADAAITVDGVTVTDDSNTIDDVIEGVTLNLVKADSGVTVTLKIEHDIDAIKANIQGFVDKYNSVMTYISTQFSYDEDSETTGGVLFGDGTLRSVKSDLTSALTQTIWGVDSDFSVLTLVGIDNELIDEDEDGDEEWILTIDDTKLTGYLQTNFNDVMSLFVAQGVTDTSTLSYIGHSRDTEEGEYTVHINRAATRGTETGNVDLSSGGAGETLTITQGNSTAAITITSGMTLADIKNEINEELDTKYAETLVGFEQLYADSTQTNEITSETTWNSVYDDVGTSAGLQNNDVIEFSGTSRSGSAISGSYTISDVTSDTVQGLLSAIEDAFSSEVTTTINTDGKIVLTDKNVGASELSLVITEPASLDFGTVETTNTGGQEGRYSMAITATDDGSNHLVLRSDDYGSTSFTISQDTSDGNYDHIVYTTTSNTTDSTSGTVYITEDTAWSDIYGASLVVTDEIDITGFARDGTTPISGTYAISSLSDPVSGLLSAIEAAYSAQGTTVDAFIRDGKVYVEDTTAGSSSISLTLTPDYVGGGSGLTLGTFDQTTERDLDLGLLNGTITGQAVAGTINGEAATGSGRVLTGNDNNVNTDGLSVRYAGTANDTDVGTIKLTLGVAELFDRTLFSITDSIDGYAAFKEDSIQDRINDLEDQIDEMEARLDRKMEMMINRFVAMELAMSRLQNQSSWLSSQLNASWSAWG